MHDRTQPKDHCNRTQEIADDWRDVIQHPRTGTDEQGDGKQDAHRDDQLQPGVTV